MREYEKFLKLAEKRRDEMRRLAATMTLRQIAERFGLSVQRVHQIVGSRNGKR